MSSYVITYFTNAKTHRVMNKIILPSVFSVFFLLLVTCGLSQDYDLIVSTKGDSIACLTHFPPVGIGVEAVVADHDVYDP